jgi:hypothetical protein
MPFWAGSAARWTVIRSRSSVRAGTGTWVTSQFSGELRVSTTTSIAVRSVSAPFRRTVDVLDVVVHECQQLEPFARYADPDGLEVTTPETHVGVDPVWVIVEVQERSRPEVEVWRVLSEIVESIDRPECLDEVLVVHAAAGVGRLIASERQWRPRCPIANGLAAAAR